MWPNNHVIPRIYIYTKIEQWTVFIIYLLDNQEYIGVNAPSEIMIMYQVTYLYYTAYIMVEPCMYICALLQMKFQLLTRLLFVILNRGLMLSK